MTCEHCARREAVVHLTRVREGTVTLRHLCRACAEAQGVHVPPPRVPAAWEAVARLDPDRAS